MVPQQPLVYGRRFAVACVVLHCHVGHDAGARMAVCRALGEGTQEGHALASTPNPPSTHLQFLPPAPSGRGARAEAQPAGRS
jgi:hypothetical protein